MKDIVILVADKNTEFAVKGLLTRGPSLGIGKIAADIFVHPHRDPGCLLESHIFLRGYASRYSRALVIFDHDGCGQEAQTRTELEQQVEVSLMTTGWPAGSVAAVVSHPELEVWVWSTSPHVDEAIGWPASTLRPWLKEQGLLNELNAKPDDPKGTLERALQEKKTPRSSSLYQSIASKVSLDGCTDPAFQKLRLTLTKWFSSNPNHESGKS